MEKGECVALMFPLPTHTCALQRVQAVGLGSLFLSASDGTVPLPPPALPSLLVLSEVFPQQ